MQSVRGKKSRKSLCKRTDLRRREGSRHGGWIWETTITTMSTITTWYDELITEIRMTVATCISTISDLCFRFSNYGKAPTGFHEFVQLYSQRRLFDRGTIMHSWRFKKDSLGNANSVIQKTPF